MPGWLANQHFRQEILPRAAKAVAKSAVASYLGTNAAEAIYDRVTGSKRKSTKKTPPRGTKRPKKTAHSPSKKRTLGIYSLKASRALFGKKRKTSSSRAARKSAYSGSSKTKRARMRRGRKGALTRKASKKTLARSRNMKEVVRQRFHICDADHTFHRSSDSVGGYTGYMTKTRSLRSRPAKDEKSNSIVVFRIDCSERHFDPAKYRAGTQILPSKVPDVYPAVPPPAGTGLAGPMPQDYFIFTQNHDNDMLIPMVDQFGLNPQETQKLEIPYTINANPDASVSPDDLFSPATYTIPNSLLSQIKINLQFSHLLTLNQQLTLKLVRYSGPDPIVSGDWSPKVQEYAGQTAAQLVVQQAQQDIEAIKRICNRTDATNGRFYSTLWQKSIVMKGLKTGQRLRTHRVNQTLNVNLKRSTCRKVIKTAETTQLGQSVLPTFEVDTNMAMYNQVFLVVSSRLFEESYVADVTVEHGSALHEHLPCVSLLPVAPPAGYDPVSSPYKFPTYAQFDFKGTIDVVHKVRNITRGTQYETSSAIGELQTQVAELQAQLGTHAHESDDDDLDIECRPDKKRHCRVTIKDGHTQIGE